MDFSKLSPDVRPVVTHRLVEADDQPSDLAAGTIAGVVAAIPPARRAAKVDVLRAVTTE